MSASTLQLTDAVRDYVHQHGVREHPVLAELRAYTATLEQGRMQISPEQGALMGLLVRLMACRQIVEVGTFTGYSSLAMALALPEGGRVTCCDVSQEWTGIAQQHWAKAGVAGKMELILGPAVGTLDRLLAEGRRGTYDLAFIDADKGSYLAYYERCLSLLRPGGALLCDNVLWSGRVADESDHSADTMAIRALNMLISGDERVDVALLPIGDGLTICHRR